MKRTAASLVIAAFLLLGCSAEKAGVPPGPAPSGVTGAAAARSEQPSGPDPALIRELPQAADAPDPVRAELPRIGAIPIVPVGVAADGQAEIPTDAAQVGWYRYGSAPGDRQGSVVLMGHRDSKGGSGALYDLATVTVGETIWLSDAYGAQFRYRVVSNDGIVKRNLPLAELFDRDGPPRLVVISCGGRYDRSLGGYLENVVLTAVPA